MMEAMWVSSKSRAWAMDLLIKAAFRMLVFKP
jgi:hypothetical protein